MQMTFFIYNYCTLVLILLREASIHIRLPNLGRSPQSHNIHQMISSIHFHDLVILHLLGRIDVVDYSFVEHRHWAYLLANWWFERKWRREGQGIRAHRMRNDIVIPFFHLHKSQYRLRE